MYIRSNYPLVLAPGEKAFNDRFFEVLGSVAQALVPQLFHTKTSAKPTDSVVTVSDIGEPELRPEGTDPIATREFSEIRKTTFTHLTYAAKATSTLEDWADKPADMKSAIPFLAARSCATKAEDLGMAVLRTGFTLAGTDTKTLFADDHPMADGGVLDNKGTTALSAAAIGVARAQIKSWPSEMGRLEGAWDAKYLVVPPALTQAALAAAQGGSNLAVLSVSDGNTIAQMGLQVRESVNLTDVTDWFLFPDPGETAQGLEFYWRQFPDFASAEKREDLYYWFNWVMRCSAGWVSPRCGFGASVAG